MTLIDCYNNIFNNNDRKRKLLKKNKITVAYAPDENYAGITSVSMISVLKNAKDEDVEFIIAHSGLSDLAIQKLDSVKNVRDCDIRYVKMDREEFAGFPLVKWVTASTWFRIKISDACPDVDRFLYLDCDTMVLSSLQHMWDIDFNGNYVATHNTFEDNHLNLKSETYFNAGVILFNSVLWREDKMFEKTRECIKNNAKIIKYADQDTLNKVIDEKKLDLPREYNYCEDYWVKLKPIILKNPKIVHFVGANPNRFECLHSMKHLWWEYARLSPFYEEFINQNIYNISKSMFMLRFNDIKYEFMSKIGSEKSRKRYNIKSIFHKRLLNSLKF